MKKGAPKRSRRYKKMGSIGKITGTVCRLTHNDGIKRQSLIYSDEAKGFAETTSKTALGVGGVAGYDATLSDKAISAALSQLVENIINKCMDKPWRAYILSFDEGSCIISGGASQGLSPDDRFKVYRKGKKVKNPQTGIEIELPGTEIGSVTVLQTTGDTPETEISICSYAGESINADELSNYYISDK